MSVLLGRLVDDYSTKKQPSLIQMKKGLISREIFLGEVTQYARLTYGVTPEQASELTDLFEQYIFGYARISPLIDDAEISDIRIVSHDNIRQETGTAHGCRDRLFVGEGVPAVCGLCGHKKSGQHL